MTSRQPIRSRANNKQINVILGNVPGPTTGNLTVTGVNPVKVTCDDLLVRNGFIFYGHMMTPFTAINGTANRVSIRFVDGSANTGIYSPAPDRVCIAIEGTPVTCFTPAGLAADYIYGPSGTIDFGGSILTNFIMNPSPYSYTLVGTPVQTAPSATTTSLVVPLTCVSGADAWELVAKTEYTAVGTSAVDNGVYTFHIRVWQVCAGPLNMSAQFDTSSYHKPAFIGNTVVAAIVGNTIEIRVTSNATQTLNWLTKCDVIRIDATS